NPQVCERELLDAVKVPGVAGNKLIVPPVFAFVGIDGNHGSDEEIVQPLRLSKLLRPRSTVSGADEDKVCLGVISDRVPHCGATAQFPPITTPSLRGHFHGLVLETLRRIARYGVETPFEFSRVHVVSREKTADWLLSARVANDSFVLGNARSHCHRVLL